MIEKYKRAKALVDLDALLHNIRAVKNNVPKETKMVGVIKADAYGHGDVAVAKAIEDEVYFLAVATTAEAVNLYNNDIKKPILILGPVPDVDYEDIVRCGFRVTIFTLDQAKALSAEAKKQQKEAYVHIAVDTGMNRIGCKDDKSGAEEVAKIAALEFIKIEGVFSHLYAADGPTEDLARRQLARFENFVGYLEELGIDPELKHISNSAGSVRNIGSSLDMVRAGIVIYGIKPDYDMDMCGVELKPVMSIKSCITHVKFIEPEETVGYGATYTASKRVKIATVSFGYGDGYPRSLSNKGYVLVRGKKAYITGRVCMDQFMVDVTDIDGVVAGDEVTILGRDGDEIITAEILGELSGRFPYELSCDWTKRVPRIYIGGN